MLYKCLRTYQGRMSARIRCESGNVLQMVQDMTFLLTEIQSDICPIEYIFPIQEAANNIFL